MTARRVPAAVMPYAKMRAAAKAMRGHLDGGVEREGAAARAHCAKVRARRKGKPLAGASGVK
jgi:hypothetical protein